MAQSKWESHVKDKMLLIEGWARDGLTDEQISKNLGIAYSTFKEYKKKYSALSDALKKGKEVAIVEIENALFKNATGYEYEEVITEIKMIDGKEHKIVKKNKKHMKGDTVAQIFWLKNRAPTKWRDKDIEGEKPDGKVTFSFKEAVIKKIEEE